MNQAESIVLLAELENEYCGLNHGPMADKHDRRACDYIVTPVGSRKNGHESVSVRELVVPVCRECIGALAGEEWTLLYCFECNESRWVLRKLAKNSYRHHILWLKGCPDCSNQFGGLYFNDFSNKTGCRLLIGRTYLEAA